MFKAISVTQVPKFLLKVSGISQILPMAPRVALSVRILRLCASKCPSLILNAAPSTSSVLLGLAARPCEAGRTISRALSPFPSTYNKNPNEIMKETHFNATEGIVLLLKQQIELIESDGKKKAQRKGKDRCSAQTERANRSLNIHGPGNCKSLNAKYLHN